MRVKRKGEYGLKGDYHKKPDKNWKYYPIYMAKMEFIEKYFNQIPKNSKILDVGAGEGILVEKFRREGYDIIGLDLNYGSKYIIVGDLNYLNLIHSIISFVWMFWNTLTLKNKKSLKGNQQSA